MACCFPLLKAGESAKDQLETVVETSRKDPSAVASAIAAAAPSVTPSGLQQISKTKPVKPKPAKKPSSKQKPAAAPA